MKITATERFFNPDNKPKDDFEKEAVQALKSGQDYFEKVETQEGGQKVLRSATPLPLVMSQCKFCHVYAKEGELMGGHYLYPSCGGLNPELWTRVRIRLRRISPLWMELIQLRCRYRNTLPLDGGG